MDARLVSSREGLGTIPHGIAMLLTDSQFETKINFSRQFLTGESAHEKTLLPILAATVFAVGCATGEHHEHHASYDSFNSPSYERVLAESKIYSPASEDLAAVSQSVSRADQAPLTPLPSTTETPTNSPGASNDSDRLLQQQVRDSLSADATLRPQMGGMQISVDGGKVTLKGTVNTEDGKQQTARIAQQTTGVLSVENELVVSEGTTPTATSFGTQSRVYPATGTPTGEVSESEKSETSSENRGAVPATVPKRDAAATEISPLSQNNPSEPSDTKPNQENGVTSNLSPTSERSESRIYTTNAPHGTLKAATGHTTATQTKTGESLLVKELHNAISGDAALSANLPNLRITEADGKVTLRGKVKSEQEKKDIEALIQRTTGVTGIDNQLEISTSP